MRRMIKHDMLIRVFDSNMLRIWLEKFCGNTGRQTTYTFLLFIYVPDLEPDVGVSKRVWRTTQNAVKALQGVVVLALLLVDNAKAEQDFISLVEVQIWRQEH